jgi:hypothetical protein
MGLFQRHAHMLLYAYTMQILMASSGMQESLLNVCHEHLVLTEQAYIITQSLS